MKIKISAAILCVAMWLSISTTIFANGDTNVDGGGGDMGSGTGSNSWNVGMDGVRVSVVETATGASIGTPIDYTNKAPSLAYHFGKKNKLQYRNGVLLSPTTKAYTYKKPVGNMPTIISSSGGTNVTEIKRYFCTDAVAGMVALDFGISFETLISGRYKLFLEPIAYFLFEGNQVGMTANEAALYDKLLSGVLRNRMYTLSHQNLPLSIFLERPDLGFPAYNGSANSSQSNDTILSSLGMGIVSYKEMPPTSDANKFDYIYRVNTEVITSVMVSGGQSDPDNPTTVQFNILGANYTVGNVFYPKDDSQLAWVRWRTPSTEQEFTIPVTVTGTGTVQNSISVKIVDIDTNPPPNPVADDRNDGFVKASLPSKEQEISLSWGVWSPWWKEKWVWITNLIWEETRVWVDSLWRNPKALSQTSAVFVRGWIFEAGHYKTSGDWIDKGHYEDQGEWQFNYNSYSASLKSTMQIIPDIKNPTANGRTIKSGYGININVSGNVSTNQSSAVTPPQNAVSYFPEFRYETYWRLLDRVQGGPSAQFEFKPNKYSTYGRRTHFLPIWMPDGAYTVYTQQLDSWTPSGMLCANLSDSVNVQGNLWSDWHISALKP